ncbi:MAG: putative Ig domain-containing protein [Myxococcota bacterium]
MNTILSARAKTARITLSLAFVFAACGKAAEQNLPDTGVVADSGVVSDGGSTADSGGGEGDSGQANALRITTSALAAGSVGAAYNAALEATGGTAPYGWAIAGGSLPAGLTLSTDGNLSGVASVAGTASFTVQVTDSALPPAVATANLTLTIDPTSGTVLAISTTSLADATVGTAYTAQLNATGGTMPYVWSLANGTALPSGLSLGADGAITGTPDQAGTTSFSVQVVDTSVPTQLATAQLSINVTMVGGNTLMITTNSLATGAVGTAYSQAVLATGGTQPYTFTIATGALPPGLSLAADGTISGTPTAAGTFDVGVQCTDSSNPAQVASRTLSLTIDSGGMGNLIIITTITIPGATVGTAYSAQLAASGGTAPYSWELGPTSVLPAGLTLSAAGVISGTPTIAGRYSFSVVATDSSAPTQSGSRTLTLVVAQAAGSTLRILNGAMPSGTVGVAYGVRLRAFGGMTPYTWTVASGALPPGVTLSMAGTVTGTPTATGNFDFNAQVTDATAPTPEVAQASFRITVLPVGAMLLAVTTQNLPNGVINQAYSAMLAATGGAAPYTWSLAGGALPAGLHLQPNGLVTGTTTVAGRARFTVSVTDAGNPQQTARGQINLNILMAVAPLTIRGNNALPNAVVAVPYTAPIGVRGGLGPYTLTVQSGRIPPGFMLDSGALALVGTATGAGTYSFTIQAADSQAPVQTATHAYTLRVEAGMGGNVRIATRGLPPGAVNTPYNVTLRAQGGTPPYTWAVTMGTLPAGITLSTAGVLSGTPTATGQSAFQVTVTDSAAPPTQNARGFQLNVQ